MAGKKKQKAVVGTEGARWMDDDLGDSENARKITLGAFELSVDEKETAGQWRAGIYVDETTEFMMEKEFQADTLPDALIIAMDWFKEVFQKALQAAGS